METKSKISEYREKLDKTLASPELTDPEVLKSVVKNQLQSTALLGNGEIEEETLEKRTLEVSDFLETLRSASVKEHEFPKSVEASHGEWKLKQDNEDFRVMYREGPVGSPYHTLLAEGYVDGPVDVCLCISWESALYQKWWPQFAFPTFKITDCKCLGKARIGEQISSIRMKVPWPMSDRGALVHYFLFEYFQDGLIVVLLKSISDSDVEDISKWNHTSNKNGVPKSNDAVMIDLVGGFALQKVGQGRSYFRTIATMDIKLDLIPPSLINFISRQLIGGGFKLYQKTVASVSKFNEHYSKALDDQLYSRIRDALYSGGEIKEAVKVKDTMSNEPVIHDQDFAKVEHDERNNRSDTQENSHPDEASSDNKSKNQGLGEIEEESHEIVKASDGFVGDGISENSHMAGKRRVCISPEVEQALGTLEKVISFVRANRLDSETPSSSVSGEERLPQPREDPVRDLTSTEVVAVVSNSKVPTVDPKKEIAERTSHDSASSSGICSVRRVGSSSLSRDRNHNKITPTLSEQDLPVSTITSINGTAETSMADPIHDRSKIRNDDGGSKDRKQKNRLCCFGWYSSLN